MARAVRELFQSAPLAGALIGVDQTGVGPAVLQALDDGLRGHVQAHLWRVTITAGHKATMEPGAQLLVPKKELVSALQMLFQARRVQIARALPDAAILVQELENFKARITLPREEPGPSPSEDHGKNKNRVRGEGYG